jgi:phosphate transport system protein
LDKDQVINMSQHLQKEIEKLKDKILKMSSVVEESVQKATISVTECNEKLAQSVIEKDNEIDRLEVDIEEECLKALVLYQPVATDLRFIIAVLKINNDLERVGDLAVNIAERAIFLAKLDKVCFPYDYIKMTDKSRGMLRRSIDALIKLDVKLACRVRAEDDEVDKMYSEIYSKVKEEITTKPEQINCLLHSLSIGRHLERIADHATNIAEDVVYLVDAEIIRHKPEVFED